MGRFSYGSQIKVDVDDRILAHLQIAIGAKLRRGQSFYFTWSADPGGGGGRTTVWVQPHIPIVFKYFGGTRPEIDQAWVDALTRTANTQSGLSLVPQPAIS